MRSHSRIKKIMPKIVFAGDRDISVRILKFMIRQGVKPSAILVSDGKAASHASELIQLCRHLDDGYILKGLEFRSKNGISLLNKITPDYIIGIHFPYMFTRKVLSIPKRGVLNLHPAYLPYNKGWHTPTWAIIDGTPYGATLHFMDEGLDTGNIIYQKELEIYPDDTAHTLYKRVKKIEFEVFKKAWPSIADGSYVRRPQNKDEGTLHKKTDISEIQYIDIEKEQDAGSLIKKLRALTTNQLKEAAYFKYQGETYRVRIKITKDII